MPYPVLEAVHIGGIHFRTWGLMVGMGLFLGAWVTTRLARRRGLPADTVWTLALVAGGAGLLGSRLLWALQPGVVGRALEDPFMALRVWDGGLTFIGGLIGATLGGVWYLRRQGLPVWRVADIVAPGFGVGLAVGRLGCYLTGLHPGQPTGLPWGIDYLGAIRHPIPLYEAALGLLLAAGALFLLRRTDRPGLVAIFTAAGYLLGRASLDLLRAPEGISGADPRLMAGLTLTQGVAVVAVPLLLIALGRLPQHRYSPGLARVISRGRRPR